MKIKRKFYKCVVCIHKEKNIPKNENYRNKYINRNSLTLNQKFTERTKKLLKKGVKKLKDIDR